MAELHKHSIAESVGHEGRATAIVEAGNLCIHGDEEDMPLSDLLEILQEALKEIPAEFRDSAIVRFRAYGDYASMSGDVVFRRPETDEELADRNRWLKSLDTDKEDEDCATYARLKAKYETPK